MPKENTFVLAVSFTVFRLKVTTIIWINHNKTRQKFQKNIKHVILPQAAMLASSCTCNCIIMYLQLQVHDDAINTTRLNRPKHVLPSTIQYGKRACLP